MRMWPSPANWKLWLKAIGLAFVISYFWNYPPHIDIAWVSAYVALALALGAVFALVANPLLVRLIPTQRFDPSPYGDRRVAQAKRRPWTQAILVVGEDGFFFVPLLLVGISPLTAAVVSVTYAAMHYPEFPVKHCVAKVVLLYLIATVILPHGLGSVIVGHLVLDAFVYYVWSRGMRPVVSEGDGH